MSFFEQVDAIVAGIEAGFTKDPRDPGNWTSGKLGVGSLKGTKYGIAASAYPELDIENLTLEQARDIRKRKYWEASGCDSMSWERALCVYDCAINQGESAEELIAKHAGSDVVEFMTARAQRYAANPHIATFGHSWFHRMFLIFKQAQETPHG